MSLLIGYAVVKCVAAVVDAIIEIAIQISSYFGAKEEIKQKAKESIGSDKDIFSMYIAQQDKYVDHEVLVVRAYDRQNNHIANITVTAANGTPLRIGQSI